MKKFKNAKLTTKMILSFCIVALLCIVTGAVGIYSILQLNTELDEMNTQMVVPLGEFIKFYDKDSNASLMVRDVMLDPQNGEKYKTQILDSQSKALEALTEYDKAIISPEAKKLMVELRTGTENMYAEQVAIVDMVLDGVDINSATFYERFGIYEGVERSNLELQQKIYSIKLGLAAELSIQAASIANTTTIITIIVAVAATILAILIGVFLARLIGKPIKAIGVAANRIVETGELGFDMGVEHTKDEVGKLAAEISALMGTFHEYSQVLEGISKGDFTVRVKVRGEKDTMGNSMRNVLLNFNEMFAEMQQVSGQVGDASRQISDGSQALAQGATEQASAIEELSASIQEISEQTNSTAEMAHRSNEASKAEIEKARKGNEQMKKLVEAVNNINEASVNISQTIKVIDDIAFQTNILALNAAVEAARAGQHGKGFAVVAEEVKNLATNSSAAAQETNDMIANSMELAKAGAAIAEAMQASLEEIVSGITDAANMVDTISTSAEEQALAINQINQGIEQVSQVVQNNSATAEESASASEEMSSQAEVLTAMVKRFKLRSKEEMANARRMQAVGTATMSAPSAQPQRAKAAPAKAIKEEISIDWDDDEEGESYNPGSFGKY